MNKQYCRYCSWMCVGDANYCGKHHKCYSDNTITKTNKCKDFEFNEIDAINGNTYRARTRKENKQIQKQIQIEELCNEL